MNPLRLAGALALACTALALATASPAGAATTVAGTGEPPVTKGTTNTWWFTSTPTTIVDARRVCITFKANGSPVGNPECSNLPLTGTHTFWYSKNNLEDGTTYSACAREEFSFPGDPMWFVDGPAACADTKIDNGKPNAALTLADGAEYTNDATVPVRIGYQDSLSPPWTMNRSDPAAAAANFLCAADPGGCSNGLAYDESCSVPEVARPGVLDGIFQNAFNCERDLSGRPDGPVVVCAVAADGAMPDNSSGSNQFGGSANQANLSDSACDQIVLDRGEPSLSIGGSLSATPGSAVSLNAQASDALSGVSKVTWSFGDGGQAEGTNVSHAYAAPGTYVVEAKAHDAAGNVKAVQATVTVASPSGGSGDGSGGGSAGGGSAGGSGGAEQAHSLAVAAKRKLRLRARPRRLRVTVAPSAAGTVEVILRRGSKRVSRAVDLFRGAGNRSLGLTLPSRLPAGNYRLSATFIPRTGAPVTRTLTIRVVR